LYLEMFGAYAGGCPPRGNLTDDESADAGEQERQVTESPIPPNEPPMDPNAP